MVSASVLSVLDCMDLINVEFSLWISVGKRGDTLQ